MKAFLFAVAMASLALVGGCAKGGNGVVPIIDITITSPANTAATAIYPTEVLTFTAAVSHSATTAVNWSLGPSATCTGTPNPCGSFTSTTSTTANYVAPATPISGITLTATLASDSSFKGNLGLTVVAVTTDIAPATLSVGNGLIQTFTAVAVPDVTATQTFTWTCTVTGGGNCANFVQDPNVSGLAYYRAQDTCSGAGCVQISAITPLDANGCSNAANCTVAAVSPVASRVNGTYAFRFSGYDGSKNATAVVGTFTAVNGTITAGTEDELTSFGPASHSITGGSYAPISAPNPNSNNAGTLALTLPSGVYPNRYQVVLDSAGDIEMIESDGHGSGSGVAQISSSPTVFKGTQKFAFGFTGVDLSGSRVGYVGLLPMDGAGNVAGGLIDVNKAGNSTNSICGSTPPCTVTGKYSSNGNGSWHLALTSPVNMEFDFFIASGTANKATPLTFYAISTDAGLNPAVSGTMVLQDSSLTYNNAAFKGTSVSALTGTALTATATCATPPCSNVSLTLGTTDGNGNFSGLFDQNNAGVILSAAQFPPATGSNNYTYAASSSNNGRYTFNMLGDPTATPAVAPLPFVLYASGANRGFLLDQSSTSVMTGTMNQQGKTAFGFPASALPSTFAAATTSSGSSDADPLAANLLLTWVNTGACTAACVNGTQYDAANPTGVTLTGANPGYTLQSSGNGTIALTAPSTQNYVIYALDVSGCTIKSGPVCAVQDFLMMDVDKTNPNASILFAQQ